MIIFHLSKWWKAKFFILCDVTFLVRLQWKFGIDHSWEWKGPNAVSSQYRQRTVPYLNYRNLSAPDARDWFNLMSLFFFCVAYLKQVKWRNWLEVTTHHPKLPSSCASHEHVDLQTSKPVLPIRTVCLKRVSSEQDRVSGLLRYFTWRTVGLQHCFLLKFSPAGLAGEISSISSARYLDA